MHNCCDFWTLMPRAEYLSQFHPAPSPQVPSFVSALTERMACRVLVFFVRHASLVRPLSNDGKLRLAKVSTRTTPRPASCCPLVFDAVLCEPESQCQSLLQQSQVRMPVSSASLAWVGCLHAMGAVEVHPAHITSSALHTAPVCSPLSTRLCPSACQAMTLEALLSVSWTVGDTHWVYLQDMGELEAGVGQSIYPLGHLGLPFNMLRAFRRLLFLDTAEVMGSPPVRELPASVVLHHLYSRAPAALQSPHVRQSFTPAQVRLPSTQFAKVNSLHCSRDCLTLPVTIAHDGECNVDE